MKIKTVNGDIKKSSYRIKVSKSNSHHTSAAHGEHMEWACEKREREKEIMHIWNDIQYPLRMGWMYKCVPPMIFPVTKLAQKLNQHSHSSVLWNALADRLHWLQKKNQQKKHAHRSRINFNIRWMVKSHLTMLYASVCDYSYFFTPWFGWFRSLCVFFSLQIYSLRALAML